VEVADHDLAIDEVLGATEGDEGDFDDRAHGGRRKGDGGGRAV
jgi:hypothetical protein